jgi:hypothetical protein
MTRFLNWLFGLGQEEKELVKALNRESGKFEFKVGSRGGLTKTRKPHVKK